MLTLSQAPRHSTKGFTQLLPPAPCFTSSAYHLVDIHLPLHLLLEAFLDSPLNCRFCKKNLHRGLFLSFHTQSALQQVHVNFSVFAQTFPRARELTWTTCASITGALQTLLLQIQPTGGLPGRSHRPSPRFCTASALLGCGAMARGSTQSSLSLRSRAELAQAAAHPSCPCLGQHCPCVAGLPGWAAGDFPSGRVAPAVGEKSQLQSDDTGDSAPLKRELGACPGPGPEPFTPGAICTCV